MLKKASKLISITFIVVLLCSIQAFAAETTAPTVANIDIVNNIAGTPDSVVVTGLSTNDIVKVYDSISGISPVGVTVSTGTTATIYINQLGTAAGSAYVTVTSDPSSESTRTAQTYPAEPISTAPLASNITIENNVVGKLDRIKVDGLTSGDIVRVYSNSVGATVISTAVSTGASTDLFVNQLGTAAGKCYISVQSTGKPESTRTAKSYDSESTTELPVGAITVTNNHSSVGSDTVTVTSSTVAVDDTITVYKSSTGTENWSEKATVAGTVTITIPQLGTSEGKVYVSITKLGKVESKRTAVSYKAEDVTKVILAKSVTVTNNFKSAVDTVDVTGLVNGTIVNIYTSLTDTPAIKTATAGSDGKVSFTLASTVLSASGGKIYVTVTSTTANESLRIPISYAKEDTTSSIVASNVKVINNYDADDNVYINAGIKEGDIVNIYTSYADKVPLTSGTATATLPLEIKIDKDELSATGGKIFVTVTSTTANESLKTTVIYGREDTTSPLLLKYITVENYHLIDDTITIIGLKEDDIVRIYPSSKSTTFIDSATVVADGTFEYTLASTVLSPSGGKIWVTVQSDGEHESSKLIVSYTSEKSVALKNSDISTTNNFYFETAGSQDPASEDIVMVSNVKENDEIKIYNAASGGTPYKTATATSDGSFEIKVEQLGIKSGKIFVSITRANKTESTRTPITFKSEPVTDGVPIANVKVSNNHNADDTVTISGLTTGQIVNVYSTSNSTTAFESAEVPSGATEVTFTLEDGILSSSGGKIYVTVKNNINLESVKTAVSYTSETTAMPIKTNVLVVNYSGTSYDTVTIVGLADGDVVTIYDTSSGENVIASETVYGKGTTLTLSANLSNDAGYIYVTVTSLGKAESKKLAVPYKAA